MHIAAVIEHLESIAPASLQESYDNSGLLVGQKHTPVNGILVCLDCIEAVVQEAIERKCNLIVAHHPIIFGGLKRFNNENYVQRTVQLAIKNDIAIYAIHTNLDNVYENGVNGKIAEQLGLKNTHILAPKYGDLVKLVCYSPVAYEEQIKEVLFEVGAGHISKYSECSFTTEGSGTYKAGASAKPVRGMVGTRHTEKEVKIEVILAKRYMNAAVMALKRAHPYEEVAYELYPTLNKTEFSGSGMVGELQVAMSTKDFLKHLKSSMNIAVIKHTRRSKDVRKVAVCGGAGQFLLSYAKSCGADVYVTSDFKYHEFFDAENELMICDVGHYESEKYTIDLLFDILTKKFTTFAVLKTEVNTNPVNYFT